MITRYLSESLKSSACTIILQQFNKQLKRRPERVNRMDRSCFTTEHLLFSVSHNEGWQLYAEGKK